MQFRKHIFQTRILRLPNLVYTLPHGVAVVIQEKRCSIRYLVAVSNFFFFFFFFLVEGTSAYAPTHKHMPSHTLTLQSAYCTKIFLEMHPY